MHAAAIQRPYGHIAMTPQSRVRPVPRVPCLAWIQGALGNDSRG